MTGTLPEAVRGRIHDIEIVGRPLTTDPLGGMSGARVFRVAGSGGTLVAKVGASPSELGVYLTLASVFADRGIRIPARHGVVRAGDETWLLLEDIPSPLPHGRWLADPAVMATLRRLHRLPPATLDDLPARFQPAWSGPMSQSALCWLGNDPDLGRRLATLRQEVAALFVPLGPISGDPNPLNWGLARDGELVLMDWERIGLGHPALDVAITLPGLPTLDEFDRVRDAYRAADVSMSSEGGGIETRQLFLAKLWTVIEFLAGTPPVVEGAIEAASGPAGRRLTTALTVAGEFRGWLRQLA